MIKRCTKIHLLQVTLLVTLLTTKTFAQQVQISIPRVTQMSNLPAPYVMRDWKDVARKYDELIFSTNATGEFLPLMRLKSNGINYPAIQPILLDTYVGSSTSGNQAEAINIIPALVGATLVGEDKSNQNGIDWVAKSKDFFNKANGQNVYLNGYSSISGGDWWYDLMPNVFFYQLYSQYRDVSDFDTQFNTVADRWLNAVYAMGGSTTPWSIPEMNYRAWRLASMTPNNNGVIEPESAGTIAWLLYHAYLTTGEKKYLAGAQLAMDFLSGLNTNPSYELQLPYGVFVAAKMNAELGTHYNIEKMVNWCFDRNPLRGWGVIKGIWNGSDVSGLIGEANDAGNDYAFAMNGFQQAAALVPMVKYDKRFAHDIAKWTLNMANASRLYYAKYLPQASQDDYAWSTTHDPESVIAYEALKENLNGKKLYGTGDAKRSGWAQTNLGVYGSSHVGYLGAIVESTNIDGILKLDVNKTDFFGQNVFPSFLVYNPHGDTRQVILSLGPQSYDLYDAVTETVLKTNVTGNVTVDVAADAVLLLVYLPSGSVPEEKNGKLYLGNDVVDYNYNYNFEEKLRIKSLSVLDTLVEFDQQVPVYGTAEYANGAVTFSWFVDGVLSSYSPDLFTWTAPAVEGARKILLQVSSGGFTTKDSIVMNVVENVPAPPIIAGFTTDEILYYTGSEASIICNASNKDKGKLLYTWTLPDGSMVSENDSLFHWNVPGTEGIYRLYCDVTNEDDLEAESYVDLLVRQHAGGSTAPYAYYPLDSDVLDYSGNGHDATRQGTTEAPDARGELNKAYKFSSANDIIYVGNEASLNFKDEITLSFWVKLDAVTTEAFILSHGSWEERWKVSVTPTKKLRWTIKTSSGTKDLDSSFPLQLNHYYHFTVVYTGYSMELYVDGILDGFIAYTGQMSSTAKALTFGQKDLAVTDYFLQGSLDEVRIYDKALAPDEIITLKSLWNIISGVDDEMTSNVIVYPNPSTGTIQIRNNVPIQKIEVYDITGRKIPASVTPGDQAFLQIDVGTSHGMVVLKIKTAGNIFYKKVMVK